MAEERCEEPDLDLLRKYAILEDRELTPFFTGREDIISRVEDAFRRVLEDCRNGRIAKERTWLIQGAPGAGKTSLLDFLAERWRRSGEGSPVAVWIGLEELADLSALFEAVAAAADVGKGFRRAETKSTQAGVSFPGIVHAEGFRSTSTPPLRANLRNLAAIKPAKDWRRPVCVMIDEIQAARERHGDCLRILHLAEHGLPVVPILAGLGNSLDVLGGKDIELSRISSSCTVDRGRLEPDEARESVRKFLAECRVAAQDPEVEAWAQEVAGLSDRWPQFLRSGIAALSAELADSGGILVGVDREAVVDRAARMREQAYTARLSSEIATAKGLIAKLMRAVGRRGFSRDEAVDTIRELDVGLGGSSRDSLPAAFAALPEVVRADAFLEELIRRGALQRSRGRTERLICPIPSFRDFLVREGGSVRVLDCASKEDAAAAAAACNHEYAARGGRSSDLRFLAESDDLGSSVEAIGGRASEADVSRWAKIAGEAI